MDQSVIKIEKLRKKYAIGTRVPYFALRDQIADLFKFKKPKKKNEEFWALKDINLEIKRGEAIGIIGRNGAGKSTLLKILSQITPPTEGKIMIDGRVASLLEVGTGFNPELTGRENIYLNGAILGMSRAEIKRKFDQIVAFSEIEKFLDTPVKRYSSGMYVRLAFAVAAHLEPEILLIDEVLAVGDAQFQKKCLGKMNEVGKHGRTIVFVSHNMAAVKSLCKRVILLERGKILADGPVGRIVSKYLGYNGNITKKNWSLGKAPENSSVKILGVSLVGGSGKNTNTISTDESFAVEILYQTKSDESVVGFTTVLHDAENNCVFSSLNNRESGWYGKKMPKGLFRTTCTIPADFLNNGEFSLTINFYGKNYSDLHSMSEVLTFEINDSPKLRGDYFGGYSGVVRPDLKWATQLIENK